MSMVIDRLARVEGRVMEQSEMFTEIRETLVRTEQRFDSRFEQVDGRLDELDRKIDRRFDCLDQKVDRRFDALDHKLDLRFDRLDVKGTRQFQWMVGLFVTTIVAIGLSTLAR